MGVSQRPDLLNGWSLRLWANRPVFKSTYFAALTPSNQGPKNCQFTVTMTGQYATGSMVGIVWGTKQYGYGCKLGLVAGPSAVFKLSDLRPGTVYSCAPIGLGSDGTLYIGADQLVTTTAAVDPLPIAGYQELEGQAA